MNFWKWIFVKRNRNWFVHDLSSSLHFHFHPNKFSPRSSFKEVSTTNFLAFKSLLLIGTSNSMFDLPVLRFPRRMQESNWIGLLQFAYYFSLWMSLILSLPSSQWTSFTERSSPPFIRWSSSVSLHTGKFSLWISHFKVPTVNSSSEQTLSNRSVAYYASNTCRVLIFQLFGFRTEVVDAESELWEVRLLKGRKWEQWKVKNSKILIYFASHRIDDCDSCLLTPLV